MRLGLIALIALLSACSSEPTSGAGTPDALIGTDSATAADARIDDSTAIDTATIETSDAGCHTLVQKGSAIGFVASTARPAMNGGTIGDGTYVLSKLEWFEGGTPPAVTIAQTIAISGGLLQTVQTSMSETERTTHAIKAVSPGYLQLEPVCPSDLSGNKPAPYNAAPAELILADDDFKVAFWFKKL